MHDTDASGVRNVTFVHGRPPTKIVGKFGPKEEPPKTSVSPPVRAHPLVPGFKLFGQPDTPPTEAGK